MFNLVAIVSTFRARGGKRISANALLVTGALVVAGLMVFSVPRAIAQSGLEASFDPDRVEFATPSGLAAKKLLLDVAQAGDRLIAVGEFGHIIYSDDGGQNWTQAEEVPTQVTLTAVAFASEKVGYAAGHDSTILKTTDGGVTWGKEPLYRNFESETPIFALYFKNEKHGFAVGAFSFMLETHDGGMSWTRLSPAEDGDYHLNDVFVARDGSLYVAAEFGTVYKSSDGGKTFETIQTPYEGSFWSGLGVSDGSVLVFGMRGNAYRTEDGGETWSKVATDTRKSLGGGVELKDGGIVLAGMNGAIAYSEDGGKTFEAVIRPDREGFTAVAPGQDGTIVIFGVPGVKIMPDNASAAREELG